MYCMDDKYNQGEKDRNKIKSKPVLWPLTVVIPIYPGWGGIPSHANGLSAFYLFKTVLLVMKMAFVLFVTVCLVMKMAMVLFKRKLFRKRDSRFILTLFCFWNMQTIMHFLIKNISMYGDRSKVSINICQSWSLPTRKACIVILL